MTVFKLILITLILNIVRYFVGGPIEGIVLMSAMHQAMPLYPEVWDNDFSTRDFVISLGYNFALWFAVVLNFHLMAPGLKGPMLLRSFISFGVSGFIFISLAAVYMNHFIAESRAFFAWSIVDALILFPLLALANSLVYPLIFENSRS